jgi:hypothetical protein
MLAGAESVQVGDHVSPWAFANFALAMRHVDGSGWLTCGMPIADYAVSAVHWDLVRAGRMFDRIMADRTDEIDGSLCQPSGHAGAELLRTRRFCRRAGVGGVALGRDKWSDEDHNGPVRGDWKCVHLTGWCWRVPF